MRRTVAGFGLSRVHIDVTLNTITLSAMVPDGAGRTPVTIVRVVTARQQNFSQLAQVGRLVRSIEAGVTTPAAALEALEDLERARPPRGIGWELFGWGLLDGSFALYLGGSWIAAVVSFLAGVVIMAVYRLVERLGLGAFFALVLGGLLAAVPGILAYVVAPSVRPSLIIASSIVVLVAGLTLVQALQDGIMGAVVTASGRFFEALLHTSAIIAGVSLGIKLGTVIGITLPTLETLTTTPDVRAATFTVLIGGVAAAGYALACYAEPIPIAITLVTTWIALGVYYTIALFTTFGYVTATAVAATLIGGVGGLLSRRFLIPPLIIAISCSTPLLPGLAIYRSIYALLNAQITTGFTNMALAIAIAVALAAGLVLGEWVAQRLRRPSRLFPPVAVRVRSTRTG